MSIPAHQKPIKSIACITTPNGPQVLTGSQDCSIKAWNLSTPQQPIQVIPTRGPVTHIEVDGSTVVFACDEPLLEEVPEVVCGMVHLFNSAAGTTVPAKRSNDIPYTHPLSVKSFKAAQANGLKA
jgi:WD40 repeat protein